MQPITVDEAMNKNLCLSYIDNIVSIKEELDYLGIGYDDKADMNDLLNLITSFKDDNYLVVKDNGDENTLYQITDLYKVELHRKRGGL